MGPFECPQLHSRHFHVLLLRTGCTRCVVVVIIVTIKLLAEFLKDSLDVSIFVAEMSLLFVERLHRVLHHRAQLLLIIIIA